MNKQAQIEAHKARVARRKAAEAAHREQKEAEDDTVYSLIAEMRRIARAKGEPTMLSWMGRAADNALGWDRLYKQGEDTGRDIDEWENAEAGEDWVLETLTQAESLDSLIARGVVIEDEEHRLTLTEEAMNMAQALEPEIYALVRRIWNKDFIRLMRQDGYRVSYAPEGTSPAFVSQMAALNVPAAVEEL
ncbi:MAG: hypothetical protein ABI700_18415 [Chloroflexota bacterium]